jgi:predicted phosphodiesterase
MKITVVSDLHLEFADCFDIKNADNADVLILSGDIMIAEDLHDHPNFDFNPYSHGAFADLGRKQQRVATFRDFLKRMGNLFPHVIYVAGNHEFYNGKWTKGIQYLRDECAKFPNVHFLERDCVKIMDVTFVGGTLWTNMNKGDPLTLHAVRDMMNDFRIIKNDAKGFTNLKPADTVIRHRETLDYIRSVVAERHDEKFVVVGHHSPSFQSVHEQYKHETLMNGAYHSDLSEFILDHPQIKLWTHGHTHHCFDYVIGETRIVCNPRGYHSDGYSEDTGWNPNMIVEV